jgi:peptide/nickel transport system substrate-binding protein
MTHVLDRRAFLTDAAAIAAAPAKADTLQMLRVGMTAADLPTVTGIPNNGGEGSNFLGYPVYDGVVNWDFQHTNEVADVTPGLFSAWKIDPADHLSCLFTVRPGVTFHDGSIRDADAIICNLHRIYDEKAPQYDAPERL